MKITSIFFYFLFFGFFKIGTTQVPTIFKNTFTEQISEEQKFKIFLDSIDKYLYRDLDITKYAINECQKIIDQKILISDSDILEFVLLQIYNEHNLANPLGAYQIISRYENQLDKFKVSDKEKGSFNYLKGFTFMAIGDLEAAQKTYYQNLENATIQKDTSTMVSTLYSLGQLYKDEEDPASAIESFEKTLAISQHISLRPSTLTLIHIELSESFQALKQTDKAMEVLDIAYQIASDGKLEILKTEILIQKGNYYLTNDDPENAKIIYDQIQSRNKTGSDENNKLNNDRFLASLYQAQNKFQLSINTHQKVLEQTDSISFIQLMSTYNNLQEINYEIGNYKEAHNYLQAFNKIKKKHDADIKKQKTDYLKIKYESTEKEKENVILAAQIVQSKNQSKILFLSLALSGLVLLLLFGAFYQKMRYSKNLEKEVSNRTINLKQTNKELKEFNRILSHDLKEPIRSIVGFSQLATKPDKNPEEKKEYLNYVISSGRQLQALITRISTYQQIDIIDVLDLKLLSLPSFFKKMADQFQAFYKNKEIELSINSSSSIHLPPKAFSIIIQIICENAIQYNHNKMVKIEVDYHLKNNQHIFEIKDNGIGIEKEYQEKIFERFQRLNNRDLYNGSGLGLSIAKKMIERMNGSISLLHSKKEEGSTFLLQFPNRSPIENNHSNTEKEKYSQI